MPRSARLAIRPQNGVRQPTTAALLARAAFPNMSQAQGLLLETEEPLDLQEAGLMIEHKTWGRPSATFEIVDRDGNRA